MPMDYFWFCIMKDETKKIITRYCSCNIVLDIGNNDYVKYEWVGRTRQREKKGPS